MKPKRHRGRLVALGLLGFACAAVAGDFQLNLPDSWVATLVFIALLPFLGIALLVFLGVSSAGVVAGVVLSERRAKRAQAEREAGGGADDVLFDVSPRDESSGKHWGYLAIGVAALACVWALVHLIDDWAYADERLHRHVKAGDAEALKEFLGSCWTCGSRLAHERHPPYLLQALETYEPRDRAAAVRLLVSYGAALPESESDWRAVLSTNDARVVSPVLERSFVMKRADTVRDAQVDLLIQVAVGRDDIEMLKTAVDAGAKLGAPQLRRSTLRAVLDRAEPRLDLYHELHNLGAGPADLPPLHAAMFQLAREGSSQALKSLQPTSAQLLEPQVDAGFQRSPALLALLWGEDDAARQRVLTETGLDIARVLQATPPAQRCELARIIGMEAVLKTLPRGRDGKKARMSCAPS